MKHVFAALALAMNVLLVPAWVDAAPLGCIATGAVNGQPTTWELIVPDLFQSGTAVGGAVFGLDYRTNAALHGSVYLLNGGFPARATWTEGPTDSFLFIRTISVTVAANMTGSGTVFDQGTTAFVVGGVTINGVTCAPATVR